MIDDLLQQANKLLLEGNKPEAVKILSMALRAEPRNENVWLSLATIADTPERQKQCYQRVLGINSDNLEAQIALASLETIDDLPNVNPEHQASLKEIIPEIEVKPPESQETEVQEKKDGDNPNNVTTKDVLDQDETELTKIPGPWSSKKISFWLQPFRTEREIAENFPTLVNDILRLIEGADEKFRKDIESLKFALKKYSEWECGTPGGNINVFLSPVFHSGPSITKKLISVTFYREASWVANILTEIGKVLIERNRDKYIEDFRELLYLSCVIVSEVTINTNISQTGGNQNSEISYLEKKLSDQIRFALGYHFRRGCFERNFQPDQELSEWLVNETLASHFDIRLRQLLANDRTRVWDYVSQNMPQVYKLTLSGNWDNARGTSKEWENLLINAGFESELRTMRSTGDLIIPDKIGEIDPDRLSQLRRAANDLNRVRDILKPYSEEINSYIIARAIEILVPREPEYPKSLKGRFADQFIQVKRSVERNKYLEALESVTEVWEQEIDNLELRDWVAYLQLKTGNYPAAEPMLKYVKTRRHPKENFATDWNLAVLMRERKDEAASFKLLFPLLEFRLEEPLVIVVLALSLKLGDRKTFINTIPQTHHLRFHPLAFTVAHEAGDSIHEQEFLDQILRQSNEKWELPSVGARFENMDEIRAVVNKAIVKGQIAQVVAWLEARVRQMPGWIPNYIVLAQVHEQERSDFDKAFEVLNNRLERELSSKPRDQRRVEDSVRDLLELCRRINRKDLGRKAYKLAKDSRVNSDLLTSFRSYAPEDGPDEFQREFQSISDRLESVKRATPQDTLRIDDISRELLEFVTKSGKKEFCLKAFKLALETKASDNLLMLYREYAPENWAPNIIPPQDPNLVTQLTWVTAQLQNIKSVSSYVHEIKVIEELNRIITKMSPEESNTLVDLINNISEMIDLFSGTDEGKQDQRRLLYEKATGYEKRFAELLGSGVLSNNVVNVLSIYHATLKQVLGNLSRQAGIGPNINAVVENRFISPETVSSTLVLRLTNISERPVTNVTVELISENGLINFSDRKERRIPSLDLHNSLHDSELVYFPFQLGRSFGPANKEAVLGISIHASAEGFPNFELDLIKLGIPIRSFQEALGNDQIPKRFQKDVPLTLSDADLFHGREDILKKIGNSFYGGKQRERYFLDGIRRVGKTSILNFLPAHLPEYVIPVRANLELIGTLPPSISQPSSYFLYKFSELIWQNMPDVSNSQLDRPDETRFIDNPGSAFDGFMRNVRTIYPNKVIFLMVDEFQALLEAIARSGPAKQRDTLTLDFLRSYADEGVLNVIFTGSTRYDKLSDIVDHRIFGSLTRLRVSFLSQESVERVFLAGMSEWVTIPKETTKRVYEITGGYPRLVHFYGSSLVDMLNQERRTIVTPDDIDNMTRENALSEDDLFRYWWPVDQLGSDEERFVEWYLHNFKSNQVVSTREFLESVPGLEQQLYKKALENLRACEVIDSVNPEYIRFRGTLLRQWLEQQIGPDNQLRVRKPDRNEDRPEDRGVAGIFVDHENLIKSLERINQNRGYSAPSPYERLQWFTKILDNLMKEAEKRIGSLSYRITVAFWNRQQEAALLPAYGKYNFITPVPSDLKPENAADFKLVSEVHRASQDAREKRTRLSHAIVVTGDGDLSNTVRDLCNDGVKIQIWGGNHTINGGYAEIVGKENIVLLDDIAGL
jgi:hypothetical protein